MGRLLGRAYRAFVRLAMLALRDKAKRGKLARGLKEDDDSRERECSEDVRSLRKSAQSMAANSLTNSSAEAGISAILPAKKAE
jgi:hypothetical protein